jgi:hypothetical protein
MIIRVLSSEANAPVDQDRADPSSSRSSRSSWPAGAFAFHDSAKAHLTRFPRRPTLSA